MSERDGPPPPSEPGEQHWATYRPGGAHPETPPKKPPAPRKRPTPQRPTLQRPQPPQTGAAAIRRRRVVASIVGLAVVVGSVGIATVASFQGSGGPGGPGGDDPAPPPDLLSTSGFEDLLAEVENETGSTEAFEAVLYPEYGALDLPVDGSTLREQSYRYDGELTSIDVRGTSSSKRFDLADLDPKAFVPLIAKVRRMVDSPTSWYVIIQKPAEAGGYWFGVYASNDYKESAFLQADRDGTVLRRYSS